MTTYTARETVRGGYYLNVQDWKLEAIDGRGGALPDGDGARYVRIPLLVMLAAAPLAGLALVVVLPFLGLTVLGEEAWRRAATAIAARRAAPTEAQPAPKAVRR